MLDAVDAQVADCAHAALDQVLRGPARQHFHQHHHRPCVSSGDLIWHAVGTGIRQRRTGLLGCGLTAAHGAKQLVRARGAPQLSVSVLVRTQRGGWACS
jgi:hypothetical protein